MKPDMLKNALAKHFEAGHKEGFKEGFKEGYAQGMVSAVQTYSAVMLLCLNDHFDFTTEQLQEMTFHINNYFDSIYSGEVSLSDISKALLEEENLKISFDGNIAGVDLSSGPDFSCITPGNTLEQRLHEQTEKRLLDGADPDSKPRGLMNGQQIPSTR